jgi:hypothetical protein
VTQQYIYLNVSNAVPAITNAILRVNRSDFGNQISIALSQTSNYNLYRFMKSGPKLISVGNYIWMVNVGNGSRSGPNEEGLTGGKVGIFDSNLSYVNEITLPNIKTWNTGYNNCCFYWQDIFWDQTSNLIFVSDGGSNQRFVIQPNPNYSMGGIIYSDSRANKIEGRTNSFASWTVDPITNSLYENWVMRDYLASNPPPTLFKAFEVNRNTFNYVKMFPGVNISNLNQVNDGLPTSFMGVNPGDPFWGDQPNWNTDGTITIFNNNIGTYNNGTYDVPFLYQINQITGVPTGIIKPNNPNDPDYVPTPVFNTSVCPIIYTSGCPQVVITKPLNSGNMTYELNFSASTILNPSITSIGVFAINLTTSLVEGTPQIYYSPYSGNYITSGFTGLDTTTTNYTVGVQYYNGVTVLNTCSPVPIP